MAKRISRIDEGEELVPAGPLPFAPDAFYPDHKLAEKLEVSTRTIKRWRQQKLIAPTIEFSSRTKRTRGHEANQMWLSRLKTA